MSLSRDKPILSDGHNRRQEEVKGLAVGASLAPKRTHQPVRRKKSPRTAGQRRGQKIRPSQQQSSPNQAVKASWSDQNPTISSQMQHYFWADPGKVPTASPKTRPLATYNATKRRLC